MIFYTIVSHGIDVGKQVFTNPKLLLHKFYNKGAVRLLHANRRPEPPTDHQHSWVNEKSILQKIHASKPSTILDCGCGEGRWGYLLKDKTVVVGVDRHKPYLQQAKRYEQVVCASVTCLPFRPKSFDAGLAVELIEHLPKQEGFCFLHELKRTIRGRIVLTTPKEFVPINFGKDHPETHRSLWEETEIVTCIAQH
jgi:ubiquinone/menaquinone biosynthesis C-methylase UbiE